jgi:hypothetical protein
MAAAPTTTIRPVSIAQLRRDGFTASQIRQLKALRASYPIREHITSSENMRRLELMRWMHQNGRLED